MKNFKLFKIIAISLSVASLLGLNSIGANAEWKEDSDGWWNTEGDSWSVGWRQIDGKWYYFGQDGYMKTGWLKDSNEKWYYLDSDGSMVHDTAVDGYIIGSDGALSQSTENISQQSDTTQNILSNINSNATTISDVTGINFNDITKIVFCDGSLTNKTVTVEDKQKIKEFLGYLDDYSINNIDVPIVTGWLHRALFYINDKEVMDICFNNPININGESFNVTKGRLDIKTIDKYLKSINPSYIEH